MASVLMCLLMSPLNPNFVIVIQRGWHINRIKNIQFHSRCLAFFLYHGCHRGQELPFCAVTVPCQYCIFDGNDHLLLLLQLSFMSAVHGSNDGGSGRDWRMALHVCNRFALLHIKFDGNPTETMQLMQYN